LITIDDTSHPAATLVQEVPADSGNFPWYMTHTCTSAGPYGGGGGGAFVELPCNAVVRRIVIRHGAKIDAIQITYRYSNRQDSTWIYHGGTKGSRTVINIDVSGGEKIIGIFGRTGAKVDMLGFITNRGRVFGPYGGCGGGPITVNSCHLRGIHGRSGALLDSIGFFCSSV